jgi:aryl sulfotransferase
MGSAEQTTQRCAALEGQRFLKSHLPLDGLPWWPEARYVVVCRDARDVFMSLLNHYSSYTDFAFALFNDQPDRVGPPMPPCPEDPRELWRMWMTRGWFDWESEGYPFWSNLYHTASYWPYRHLSNVLFLHYNDMLADLEGAVRRLAGFCRIEVDDELVARVARRTTFSNLKRSAIEAEKKAPPGMPEVFRGGQQTFFNKGTNGRWRDVLTDEDLELYAAAKQRVLEPDCARWLETGGPVP